MKLLITLTLAVFLAGCVGQRIDYAIGKHEQVSQSINLGDSRDVVLSILKPTQTILSSSTTKPPGKYMKDGVLVEIYYMRTGRQPDGLTTDDEFTPYIFHDGRLVGIGWELLGGAKSQGQVGRR